MKRPNVVFWGTGLIKYELTSQRRAVRTRLNLFWRIKIYSAARTSKTGFIAALRSGTKGSLNTFFYQEKNQILDA
jgi:hypothetical protein